MLKSILDVCSQFAVGSLWIHGVGIFVSMEGEYSSEILDFFFCKRDSTLFVASLLWAAPRPTPPPTVGGHLFITHIHAKKMSKYYMMYSVDSEFSPLQIRQLIISISKIRIRRVA